jgi:hypothetical protein
VAADLDHALDTWRWVLRLQPSASLAVQIAALFHDVERLIAEPDVRVEHHAADYAAFKQRHAARGAALTRAVLQPLGPDQALLAAVEALVAGHEQGAADPDRQLLNTADALSFFSLNACGFINYYGPAHTERKIAYTLDRLSPAARPWLGLIRHRRDVFALLVRQAPELAPPRRAEVPS